MVHFPDLHQLNKGQFPLFDSISEIFNVPLFGLTTVSYMCDKSISELLTLCVVVFLGSDRL